MKLVQRFRGLMPQDFQSAFPSSPLLPLNDIFSATLLLAWSAAQADPSYLWRDPRGRGVEEDAEAAAESPRVDEFASHLNRILAIEPLCAEIASLGWAGSVEHEGILATWLAYLVVGNIAPHASLAALLCAP